MRRLEAVYEKLQELYSGKGISAFEIAEGLNLSRANVSNDLNRLFEFGRVSKTKGRPVLYSPIQKKNNKKYVTVFDKFARRNPSLYPAVQQAKAAVLYPPNGMHMLILGETGVGKSMFADLIHGYAIEMGKMDKDSDIITFNCADYANNPQLLISQLFGVSKGSFTGADLDKVGLIEKANGGILFLDEVHRLPPEGQEMFFAFMDKGVFRRLGETDDEREAKVIIVAATTEDPDSALLRTFIRRFPMILTLPDLAHRTYEEKFGLISKFFREEAVKFNSEIIVSINTLRALLAYRCNHNIGQLKNDIKLICAKAYLQFISESRETIKINSTDLHDNIRDGLYKNIECGIILESVQITLGRYCVFNPKDDDFLPRSSLEKPDFNKLIEAKINELISKGKDFYEIKFLVEYNLNSYIRGFIESIEMKFNEIDIMDICDTRCIEAAYKFVELCEKNFNRVLDEDFYRAIVIYFDNIINKDNIKDGFISGYINDIVSKNEEQLETVTEIVKVIEDIYGVLISKEDISILSIFLIYGYDLNLRI
ncbi:sigma 54-interacting transcriptional regulator [Clostridium sp. 'White wine YQ']|uniref:sigma 54-interacting transcriptional regulator n=1 Tax=Clostridium sp. 'White wine YQ' TaxID=3027474 RepID=UPI002366A8AB|nr:sigma 54-interacting transcriptional regulator [Clostridium sp. 'White wine YQ']MDD7793391.1 sigma 54-interacting transcriptional regulator [Clostridium sp. 'White wine YQ']